MNTFKGNKKNNTDFYQELKKQNNQKFESFDFIMILVYGIIGYLVIFLIDYIIKNYGY